MISYFFIYLIPFVLAISWSVKLIDIPVGKYHLPVNHITFSWVLVGLIFIIFIGYRHEIGGDWHTYLRHFNVMPFYNFDEIIKRADPGYYSINWLLSDWGFSMYSVNTVCGSIFVIGLIIFSKRQPNPWLSMAVAFPYLVVVVAMGYTRQGVALGFIFWGLAALDNKNFKKFLILVALAATFHKSAVLMIGLGVFLQGKGKVIRFVAVIIVAIGIWNAFLAEHQQQLWESYVSAKMQSQGALIRVIMNVVPALIFFWFRKIWRNQFEDYNFWMLIAIGSIASVVLVGFASTAVDRVALYFTPIQVVVYSRLPYLLRHSYNPQAITIAILLYYSLVLYVWLNYAVHSRSWVPYNNLIFEG
jgi:hypothetical protein